MTLIRLLSVLLFIYIVGHGFAESYEEKRPTQVRRTYRSRAPTHTHGTSARRTANTRTSSKGSSFFQRIMERAEFLRKQHEKKHHNKGSSRKTANTRQVRRSQTRRYQRPTAVRRTNTRVVERRPTTVRRTRVSERRPTYVRRTRVAERRPTAVRRTRVAERRPTVVRRTRVSERRPTVVRRTRVSERRPTVVRRTRVSERRPTVVRRTRVSERRPIVPVRNTNKKKSTLLFDRIMSRITDIRNDKGGNQIKKPIVIPRRTHTHVVHSHWRPRTCLRKGCSMTSGVAANYLGSSISRAYKGDKNKLLKVVTWNIFEGRTPNNYLRQARSEVCARLKLMESTIYGFQDASIQQIRDIEKCLQRHHYHKYQGQGRYDYSVNRYMYNPVFYRVATHGPSVTKLSNGYIRTSGRTVTPIASYMRVRFNTPKGTAVNGKNGKKNDISQLWKRLNTIFNKAQNGRITSSSASKKPTEVLLVNLNLITDKVEEAERHIGDVLKKVAQLTRRWTIPVILMGDFKFEDNSKVFKAISDANRHLHNTFDKRVNHHKHVHPMLTRFKKRNEPQDFVHYILQSKLSTVYAATISDRLPSDYYKPISSKPVLAAFKMT